MQPAPQDNQLMPKHRVLGLEPHLRLERRGHGGQDETEKSDHSASLGNIITSSTRTGFSVHTGSSHSIACFDVRGDFRFGLVFPFFSFGEPYETFSRVAHCELAKLSL
jgi:hypothetical protein